MGDLENTQNFNIIYGCPFWNSFPLSLSLSLSLFNTRLNSYLTYLGGNSINLKQQANMYINDGVSIYKLGYILKAWNSLISIILTDKKSIFQKKTESWIVEFQLSKNSK